ncbi:MbtH family protein [Micromonospora andamanensis]|uniref:MbtH-like domain-containing protein n=2 Tax=Micromonospora andamanensis TaxID=1287068 RepID=A0ABQ4HTH5_9ACTN|nr:MbtH family protein [Micromonospora andamanensis]GIJ08940.1 hypothetical protein Van01_21540 [Micromonospora andamanensis]
MDESSARYRFAVVHNDEDQYSIWPDDQEPPPGWRREGTAGSRQQCLDHIGGIWTDITPRSLRAALDRDAAGR